MKTGSLLITALFTATLTFGQTTKVLFIGNSYISVNNLPNLTKNLALSLNDTLIVDSNAPGGQTFNNHTNNATTLNKIGQGGWDFVILQGQSQEPSFSPSQVAAQTLPYAAILVDSIMSANPCATPLFYMTWGRQNGDASNCTNYPPICTFDGMNARLRTSYLLMAQNNNAEVAPVGAAWKYVRDTYPTINLYDADQSHPSLAGSYLAACVHYAMIYKKSPVGAPFISTLNSADAGRLQLAAKLVVLDSLATWNAGVRQPNADFTAAVSNNTVSLQNNSINATTYHWNFGNGTTSTLQDPTVTYYSNGQYTVELIASNQCTSDTTITQVTINTVSSVVENNVNFTISTAGSEIVLIHQFEIGAIVKLYTIEGKLVSTTPIQSTSVSIQKPTVNGYYLVEISNKKQTEVLGSQKIYIQ